MVIGPPFPSKALRTPEGEGRPIDQAAAVAVSPVAWRSCYLLGAAAEEVYSLVITFT